jgi:hypothetical protein
MNVQKKVEKFYILALVNENSQTGKAFRERQKILGVTKTIPHLSLMTIIPLDSIIIDILKSEEFEEIVNKAYETCMLKKRLVHVQEKFDLMGEISPVNKFWAKKYFFAEGDGYSIGEFRLTIYKYITDQFLHKHNIVLTRNKTVDDYVYYESNGRVMYKVPYHSWGTDENTGLPKFKPHLSICNIGNLKFNNTILYNMLVRNNSLNPNSAHMIHKYINNNKGKKEVPQFNDIVFGVDINFPIFSWK